MTLRSRPLALQRLIWIAGAALVLGLGSCGRKQVQTRAVFPTKGQVFYQGQPATGATVILHPLSAGSSADWPLGFPSGTVGTDGTVQFHTFGENDGAPEGEYAVLVMWTGSSGEERGPEDQGEDKLAGRYAEAASSQWHVKVEQKPTQVPRVDLN